MEPNKLFIEMLINEAVEASKNGCYSVAALVVKDNMVIAKEHTAIAQMKDPTAHAEILAIRKACKELDSHLLEGCYLYTTLEPCPMCTSAAIWAKMKGIVFGATQEDAIEVYSKTGKFRQIPVKSKYIADRGVPNIDLYEEFMREECKKLLYIY